MVKIIEVNDWEALAVEIRRCEEAEPKIYRGATNFAKHKLIPKIGRTGARKNPSDGSDLPHSEHDEKRFLELFRRTARPFLSYEPPATTQPFSFGTARKATAFG